MNTLKGMNNIQKLMDKFMKMGEEKMLYKVLKEIKELKNPYPKDIFLWDSKKECEFNRGRFHQHCFEIVENTREDIIKLIREIE